MTLCGNRVFVEVVSLGWSPRGGRRPRREPSRRRSPERAATEAREGAWGPHTLRLQLPGLRSPVGSPPVCLPAGPVGSHAPSRPKWLFGLGEGGRGRARPWENPALQSAGWRGSAGAGASGKGSLVGGAGLATWGTGGGAACHGGFHLEAFFICPGLEKGWGQSARIPMETAAGLAPRGPQPRQGGWGGGGRAGGMGRGLLRQRCCT